MVPDPDFPAGLASWRSTRLDLLGVEASDRGAGRMLHIADSSSQPLAMNSYLFPVTAGAAITFKVAARIAPVSRGYFAVIFVAGNEVSRTIVRFTPSITHIAAVSDASGRVRWQLPAASMPAELDAHFAGDVDRWPASVVSLSSQ
jgi:hypothetical protein